MASREVVRTLLAPLFLVALSSFYAVSPAFAGCISIAYYVVNVPDGFLRSVNPIDRSTSTYSISQTPSGGSVLLATSTTTGTEISSGFYFVFGTLGSLTPLSIMVTDLTQTGNVGLALNLWFDVSGNEEFFAWDPTGMLTGLDGDKYGLGPNPSGGFLTVDDSTSFFMIPGGGTFTVAQLKSGSVAGINANTLTAVWIGVDGTSGSGTARIMLTGDSSVQLCPSAPVGGFVESVSRLAVLSPWLAVIGAVGCIGIAVVIAKKRRS